MTDEPLTPASPKAIEGLIEAWSSFTPAPRTGGRHDRGGGVSFTVGLRMVWFTGHNAYHLGQVVFMRRVLGAWPPPGGSGPN